MSDQQTFEIFISSKMREFEAARKMLHGLMPTLGTDAAALLAWVYEINAPASDDTVRDVYLETLDNAELYLGILGEGYGAWTIDEFNRATDLALPRYVFVKNMPDNRRDPKLQDFLKQIQGVDYGIAPRYFDDVESLKAAVKHTIEGWLRDRLTHRSGSTTAILADHPAKLRDLPDKLIGRENLLAELDPLLKKGERVLLQGFGGMGKTSLAAQVAANWIDGGSETVLWQQLGSERAEVNFAAMARPFGLEKAIASATGTDQQQNIILDALLKAEIKLVVLDDAWDGTVLKTVLDAIPRGTATLITARGRYAVRKVLRVGELPPDKALATLGFYADKDFSDDDAAAQLCQLLGYHAFALEVAGRTLNAEELTPAALHHRIKDSPHKMQVPDEFAAEGRRTVADLLTASLTMLDNETQGVFTAMGAFFARQMTPEMLALYFMGKPEVSDEMLADVKRQNSQLSNMVDDELRPLILQQVIYPNLQVDTSQIETRLETLARRGLAEKEPATDNNVTAYRLHDLAYSYAGARHSDENRHRALDACLAYTERYNEPSLANFAALRPELDNMLKAAEWAMLVGRYAEVERFAWNLYVGDGRGGVLNLQGFYTQATGLLAMAAGAAERQGNQRDQGAHLTHLGLCYSDLGQYQKAITYYEQSLMSFREAEDRKAEGSALGNLGIAYAALGQYDTAIEYYEQALVISREIGDRRGEGSILGNLGNAYYSLGQYDTAIEYHQQALAISREIGDRRGEGQDLGNLGIAYKDLGQTEQAIEYHQQALAISREIGDRLNEGNQLGNLGNAYADLGQYDTAIEYYEQAIEIRRAIGDRLGESNDLNNIGALHEAQGDYQRALDFYQQARATYVALGTQHIVARVDARIENVRGKLAGG